MKRFVNLSKSFERPTPIVFLCGEHLGVKMWEQSAVKFSQSGFGGVILELPLLPTIEENLQTLHTSISRNCFRPPILVAHSMGTFFGQKYLESFPLSGLIMVNPIPPSSGEAIRKLISRWNSSHTQMHQRLASYYKINQSIAKDLALSEIHSSKLMSYDLEKDWLMNDKVQLEPESVPMFVIGTKDDENILSDTDRSNIIDYHNIDEEYYKILTEDFTRMPMIASQQTFIDNIFEWTDSIA